MIELALLMALAWSGPFDATDPGIGARVGWRANTFVGVEGEVAWYPSDFADPPAFSANRLEMFGGVTAGPSLGRLRPFGRLRAGLLRFGAAPEPFACILIFPPPLACALAAGYTGLAIEGGAGVEVATTRRTFARFDVGDRMVRYPGPVFQSAPRRIRERPFFGHDVRISFGAGVRF